MNTIVRVYVPTRCRCVPSSVASLLVRLAIHQARPLQAPPDHLAAALAAGAMGAVWGAANDVAYVVSRLPNLGLAVKTVDVLYFVRSCGAGGLPRPALGDHACVQRTLRIIGSPGNMTMTVCFPAGCAAVLVTCHEC